MIELDHVIMKYKRGGFGRFWILTKEGQLIEKKWNRYNSITFKNTGYYISGKEEKEIHLKRCFLPKIKIEDLNKIVYKVLPIGLIQAMVKEGSLTMKTAPRVSRTGGDNGNVLYKLYRDNTALKLTEDERCYKSTWQSSTLKFHDLPGKFMIDWKEKGMVG